MATWHIYTFKGSKFDSAKAIICRWENVELNPDSYSPGFVAHHIIENTDLRAVKKLASSMAPDVYFGRRKVR
jgi:hypothetical protein